MASSHWSRCAAAAPSPPAPSSSASDGSIAVHLAETDEQLALRRELRAYLAELLPPAVRAEVGNVGDGAPLFRAIVRRLGADGWLGLGWPVEYGGQGRSAIDQFVMF